MFNQKSTASYSRSYSRKTSVYFMLFVCVFMFLSSVTTYASHCGALAKEANDALKNWTRATSAFVLATATADRACDFAGNHPSPETAAACFIARAAQTAMGVWLGFATRDYYQAAKAYNACMNEHSGSEN